MEKKRVEDDGTLSGYYKARKALREERKAKEAKSDDSRKRDRD